MIPEMGACDFLDSEDRTTVLKILEVLAVGTHGAMQYALSTTS